MIEYDAEYTISEVSDITGYAPHVLRYYEKEFDIDVPRKDSNHRYYTYKEIELIQYIKSLQDKGFSNKQIKLIINSPELVIGQQNETSLEVVGDNSLSLDPSEIAMEITEALGDKFFERLSEIINMSNKENLDLIEEMKEEIISLRHEINSKERDVLICENAKLKMEITKLEEENKELKFEIASLKMRLHKYEEERLGFFRRLFKAKAQ